MGGAEMRMTRTRTRRVEPRFHRASQEVPRTLFAQGRRSASCRIWGLARRRWQADARIRSPSDLRRRAAPRCQRPAALPAENSPVRLAARWAPFALAARRTATEMRKNLLRSRARRPRALAPVRADLRK